MRSIASPQQQRIRIRSFTTTRHTFLHQRRPTLWWMSRMIMIFLLVFGTFLRIRFVVVRRSSQNDKEMTMVTTEEKQTKPTTTRVLMYHEAKTDRSGAVIHDMLLAHAFAFAHNFTYAGACSPMETNNNNISKHQSMIHVLGLSHILSFACPSDRQHDMMTPNPNDTIVVKTARDVLNIRSMIKQQQQSVLTSNYNTYTTSTIILWVDRYLYTRSNTKLWTPAWLAYMRSQQQVQPPPPMPSRPAVTSSSSIVVHIRRGDVSLCNPHTRDRYLPNAYYIHLLDHYINASSSNDITPVVTIVSEHTSIPEGWNDFETQQSTRNIRFQFDGSPMEAWRTMMQAQTLILSTSSFSIVPALFARGQSHSNNTFNTTTTVIYTPCWIDPLPQWIRVDDETVRNMRRTSMRLQDQLCVPQNRNDKNNKLSQLQQHA